jgi:hypothetical protein
MHKRLSDFRDYDGVDANLETSLYEYGLIWKKFTRGNHKGNYHFIYGVEISMKTGEYVSFDWGDIKIDCNPKEEWNFVDWKAILSFIGYEGEEERYFQGDMLPQIVADLISYYGYENIFGSSYYPFEIHKRG